MKVSNLGWAACLALACVACGESGDGDKQPQPPDQPPQQPDEMEEGGSAAPSMPGDDEPAGNAGGPSNPGNEGTAGAGNEMPGAGGDGAMMPGTPSNTLPSVRGMCASFESGYVGDEACLPPPDPDKGFQIHVGPSDYDDPAQVEQFIFNPGQESSECYLKKLALDHNAHYMVYELSGRPGTHHIINTLRTDDAPEGWGTCSGLGGSRIGGASKPHMPPLPIAPENEGLAFALTANQQAQHDMHYFNFTEDPILREFWMNVYFVADEAVKQTPGRVAGLGGFAYSIQPGTHQVYAYECPITTAGRIITLLGHTHAHALRETAHIRRASGERDKVFEQYDYLEPQVFMYDTVTTNPEFSVSNPGAWTGLLEVSAGDVLEWECEVHNTSEMILRYTNHVMTGEMCNIWGTTVGPNISCGLP